MVILERRLRAFISLKILIIATLIISAADPCIGALMAFRSAKPRTVAFAELISRRYRLRFISVSTYPFAFANSMVSLMYFLMPGY